MEKRTKKGSKAPMESSVGSGAEEFLETPAKKRRQEGPSAEVQELGEPSGSGTSTYERSGVPELLLRICDRLDRLEGREGQGPPAVAGSEASSGSKSQARLGDGNIMYWVV